MSVANIWKLQENTAALYKIVYETLRVGAIRGSGYVRPEKLKRSPFLSGVRIPDVNIWVEVHGNRMQWQQSGCKKWQRTSGWKWRRISVCKWQQSGANPTRICCPNALWWCIQTPCPSILLAWIPKNSPPSQICFGNKKAIKTPKLNILWLELITRVLNMPIELKGDNSKVFKRVSYKLWNSNFWVLIMYPVDMHPDERDGYWEAIHALKAT